VHSGCLKDVVCLTVYHKQSHTLLQAEQVLIKAATTRWSSLCFEVTAAARAACAQSQLFAACMWDAEPHLSAQPLPCSVMTNSSTDADTDVTQAVTVASASSAMAALEQQMQVLAVQCSSFIQQQAAANTNDAAAVVQKRVTDATELVTAVQSAVASIEQTAHDEAARTVAAADSELRRLLSSYSGFRRELTLQAAAQQQRVAQQWHVSEWLSSALHALVASTLQDAISAHADAAAAQRTLWEVTSAAQFAKTATRTLRAQRLADAKQAQEALLQCKRKLTAHRDTVLSSSRARSDACCNARSTFTETLYTELQLLADELTARTGSQLQASETPESVTVGEQEVARLAMLCTANRERWQQCVRRALNCVALAVHTRVASEDESQFIEGTVALRQWQSEQQRALDATAALHSAQVAGNSSMVAADVQLRQQQRAKLTEVLKGQCKEVLTLATAALQRWCSTIHAMTARQCEALLEQIELVWNADDSMNSSSNSSVGVAAAVWNENLAVMRSDRSVHSAARCTVWSTVYRANDRVAEKTAATLQQQHTDQLTQLQHSEQVALQQLTDFEHTAWSAIKRSAAAGECDAEQWECELKLQLEVDCWGPSRTQSMQLADDLQASYDTAATAAATATAAIAASDVSTDDDAVTEATCNEALDDRLSAGNSVVQPDVTEEPEQTAAVTSVSNDNSDVLSNDNNSATLITYGDGSSVFAVYSATLQQQYVTSQTDFSKVSALRDALNTTAQQQQYMQAHVLLQLLNDSSVSRSDALLLLTVADVSKSSSSTNSDGADLQVFTTDACDLLQVLEHARYTTAGTITANTAECTAVAAAEVDLILQLHFGTNSKCLIAVQSAVAALAAVTQSDDIAVAACAKCSTSITRALQTHCAAVLSSGAVTVTAAAVTAAAAQQTSTTALTKQQCCELVRSTLQQLRTAQVTHGCLWAAVCDPERVHQLCVHTLNTYTGDTTVTNSKTDSVKAMSVHSEMLQSGVLLSFLSKLTLASQLTLYSALLTPATAAASRLITAGTTATGSIQQQEQQQQQHVSLTRASVATVVYGLVAVLSLDGVHRIAQTTTSKTSSELSELLSSSDDILHCNTLATRECSTVKASLESLLQPLDAADTGALPHEVVVCAVMCGTDSWCLTHNQAVTLLTLAAVQQSGSSSDAAAATYTKRSSYFDYFGPLSTAIDSSNSSSGNNCSTAIVSTATANSNECSTDTTTAPVPSVVTIAALVHSVHALLQVLAHAQRIVTLTTAPADTVAALFSDDNTDSSNSSAIALMTCSDDVAQWRVTRAQTSTSTLQYRFSAALDCVLQRMRYRRYLKSAHQRRRSSIVTTSSSNSSDNTAAGSTAAATAAAAEGRVERQRLFRRRIDSEKARITECFAAERQQCSDWHEQRLAQWQQHRAVVALETSAGQAAEQQLFEEVCYCEDNEYSTLQSTLHAEHKQSLRKASATRATLQHVEQAVQQLETAAFSTTAAAYNSAVLCSIAQADDTAVHIAEMCTTAAARAVQSVSTLKPQQEASNARMLAAHAAQKLACQAAIEAVAARLAAAMQKAAVQWQLGNTLADTGATTSVSSTGLVGHMASKKAAVAHWNAALLSAESAKAQLLSACVAMNDAVVKACATAAAAVASEHSAYTAQCAELHAATDKRTAADSSSAAKSVREAAAQEQATVEQKRRAIELQVVEDEKKQISVLQQQQQQQQSAMPTALAVVTKHVQPAAAATASNTTPATLEYVDTDTVAQCFERAVCSSAVVREHAVEQALDTWRTSAASTAATALQHRAVAVENRRCDRQVGGVMSGMLTVVCGRTASDAAATALLSTVSAAAASTAAATAKQIAAAKSAAASTHYAVAADRLADAQSSKQHAAALTEQCLLSVKYHVSAAGLALQRVKRRQPVTHLHETVKIETVGDPATAQAAMARLAACAAVKDAGNSVSRTTRGDAAATAADNPMIHSM
jgi:hypothetical protein